MDERSVSRTEQFLSIYKQLEKVSVYVWKNDKKCKIKKIYLLCISGRCIWRSALQKSSWQLFGQIQTRNRKY